MQLERLALSVIPGAGWCAAEIRQVAAAAQLIGTTTERIQVGTS
jgi:hypothetical protein